MLVLARWCQFQLVGVSFSSLLHLLVFGRGESHLYHWDCVFMEKRLARVLPGAFGATFAVLICDLELPP